MDKPKKCLRQNFTAKIAGHLRDSHSVNVFGVEKQGLKRLIEDTQATCPPNTLFIRINMKSYAHSFSGYLTALCDSLGMLDTHKADMRGVLLDYLDKHPEQKIWLCLEEFDKLSERAVDAKTVDAQGYNLDFLNHLNSFNNNPRIALFLTSSRKIDAQELYIGGQRVRGSRLDIAHELPLPRLDFSEIEDYLLGIAKPTVAKILKKEPAYAAVLIPEINKHPDPVGWMDFIADSLPEEAGLTIKDYEKLCANWKKAYQKQQSPSLDLRLGTISRDTSHWARRAGRVLGISKNIKNTQTRLVLATGVLGSVIWFLWDKIVALYNALFN
ncbi:MAG: hypothetical protein HUU34_09885 [Saprospiraceae bacterium]|jgi:hypothetical protein|nr:hypothetical protein [Saprospiraceae bacterium]